MEKTYFRRLKLVFLAAALPFIYGCGPGAGTASLLSFLFSGGGGSVGGGIALLGGAGAAAAGSGLVGSGAELATLHHPEPASMLLFGGGLAVMSYFKAKTSSRTKK